MKMKNSFVKVFIGALVTTTWLNNAVSYSGNITDECLGCICFASTGCNINRGCNEDAICGPFLIGWSFWGDAGKPVLPGNNPNDPTSFRNCANDLICSEETVRSYYRIFGRDCNNDGVLGCEDFVRIHQMGPGNCKSDKVFETPFYKKFSICKDHFNPK